MRYAIVFAVTLMLTGTVVAQDKFFAEKDLQSEWMIYENEAYVPVVSETKIENTVYLKFLTNRFSGRSLAIHSTRSFFIFFNGKLAGEYQQRATFSLDSLSSQYFTPSLLVTIHQKDINRRDLKTVLMSSHKAASSFNIPQRPSTYFKDFVILAGLIIIVLFLVITRLNPKLASDYFSVIKILSLREGDDAQANARLTSSANIQYYVSCSLLLGLYLMIILYNLPDEYAMPIFFEGHSFWAVVWQWIRLSSIVLGVFCLKIIFIFSLTRLFGLRGLARIHFFNWVRLMLIVFGALSIILFIYFISRGQSPGFFIFFLSLIIATLTGWVVVVFLKLNGKSEHSMFHLFSYICATEIIPLLITIKVLFQ